MKWPRCSLGSARLWAILPIAAILLLVTPVPVGAVDQVVRDTTNRPPASSVGLRLGVWIDQGEELNDPNINADFTSTGFITELFYNYRLMPWLSMEISMGVASRGDVIFTYGSDRYIGTINLYPMMVQMKVKPRGLAGTWQPYLLGGGGVIVGKMNTDVVLSNGSYLDPYYVESSETALGYDFGAGIDVVLSRQLGLTISGKYHSINFGDNLAGISDYSGTSVAVGLLYYINPAKRNAQSWRRP
jgi:hypothetical protein